MSDVPEQVQKKYDVFMVYTDSDKDLAIHVERSLKKKDLSVISQLDPTAFPEGTPIFDNVTKHLDSSSKTLIILTEKSYKNSWIHLETILSAEKSIKEGKMMLRVLVRDLSKKRIEFLKMGLLEKVPIITFNVSNEWETDLHEFVTSKFLIFSLKPIFTFVHFMTIGRPYCSYPCPHFPQICSIQAKNKKNY